MKNRRTALITLLTILLLALPPAPARADIAPPPMPVVGGLGILEYQNTNVEMRSERVEMELGSYPFEDKGKILYRPGVMVNAWFVMHNTGSQDETMQVVFPLDDMNRCFADLHGFGSYTYLRFLGGSFEAQVNGEHVEVTNVITKVPYDNTGLGYCDDEKMNWAAFNVIFPAGEDILIRVSYRLDGGGDSIFSVGYTLQTGAAWKGTIGEAIIVFRFPDVVQDFILPGTTSGYQTMQNEIYWRYENLEPTIENNIRVGVINPQLWATIRDDRRRIKYNAHDDLAWAHLAESFADIAHWHFSEMRSQEYNQRAYNTYREGLKANPDSAALNAGYAYLLYRDCCFRKDYSKEDLKVIQSYVAKALSFDPSNQYGLEILNFLHDSEIKLEITPGPTITPTVTATPGQIETITISETPTPFDSPTLPPSPTYTRRPTITPVPTETQTARPSQTAQPSQTPTQAAASASITGTSVAAAAATRAATRVAPNGGPSSIVATVVSLVAVAVVFGVLILGRMLRNRSS